MSFVPNMLGHHEANIVMAINGGAGVVRTNVFGYAHKIGSAGGPGGGGGTRKVIKGGLSALPEHFDPKFIFKEPEEYVARAPPAPWKSLRGPKPDLPAWKKVPPPIPDGANPDMCTSHELEARAQHRLRYAEYLKQQHTLRFEQEVLWENGPDFQVGLSELWRIFQPVWMLVWYGDVAACMHELLRSAPAERVALVLLQSPFSSLPPSLPPTRPPSCPPALPPSFPSCG